MITLIITLGYISNKDVGGHGWIQDVPDVSHRVRMFLWRSKFALHFHYFCSSAQKIDAIKKYLNYWRLIFYSYIKSSAKRWAPGLVNFVLAVAHHFCLALHVAFTQPGACLLAESCRMIKPKKIITKWMPWIVSVLGKIAVHTSREEDPSLILDPSPNSNRLWLYDAKTTRKSKN